MPIDWKKPIQTRSGLPARVLCTDLKAVGGRPVAVAITGLSHPGECVLLYPASGVWLNSGGDLNIVNVPRPRPHADIIKAWADGAAVQFRCNEDYPWCDIDHPEFDPSLEYRVKP